MDSISKNIGSRIKAARLEKKLSREQIARRLGKCQQTIAKYEAGDIEISVIQLTKISNILNVNIMYFLQPAGDDDSLLKHFLRMQLELTKKN